MAARAHRLRNRRTVLNRALAASFARVFPVQDLRPMLPEVGMEASFDGVVAFYAFNHVPQQELAPTLERIFMWLRPGGRLMTSLLLRSEAEDRVEEWLGVPMFFAGSTSESGERLLREIGFRLQMSEVRDEGVDDGYGPVTSYWVIATKPDD